MMDCMSNVKYFPTGQLESKAVFEAVKDMEFKELVVIGIDAEGCLFISGMSDQLGETNALIDVAKAYIVGQMYGSVRKIE